jgi:hypothetical protein
MIPSNFTFIFIDYGYALHAYHLFLNHYKGRET